MKRILPVVVLILVQPLAGWSQGKLSPYETVVRLKVHAAPAPVPSLKYQLLPELREMNPGNPVQGYMRCFADQHPFFYSKQDAENRDKWAEIPLKELPLKELRGHAYTGAGGPLKQADYAARLDKADWQILLRMKSDTYQTLIPDVQIMRLLAQALRVRFRGEIAAGRFDEAQVTAKTMFALSRHLGEHPSLIGQHVGVHVATLTIESLEEMIQQPGSQNLYWALTYLPSPFIDFRTGLQFESMICDNEFKAIRENEVMSEVDIQKTLEKLDRVEIFKQAKLQIWVKRKANDREFVLAARKRLAQSGLKEEKVNQFPATQIAFLDAKLTYETLRDEAIRAVVLPFWEAKPILDGIKSNVKKAQTPFADLLQLPVSPRSLPARLDRHFALLRCVEALRMYAAENDGKLPDALADTKLPLPLDPYTGKAFLYRRDGDTAILHGTVVPMVFNLRYEITLVK